MAHLSGTWQQQHLAASCGMFTAKHAQRDPLHTRDIAGASPASTLPFARTCSQANTSLDIAGAQPRLRAEPMARGAERAEPPSRALSSADIASTRPWALRAPSGRDPVDPVYELPRATSARALAADDANPHLWRGERRAGHVRETNYTVDCPRVLFPGAAGRPAPPLVDGASVGWRARAVADRLERAPTSPARAARADSLDVADISQLKGWRVEPPPARRDPPRDPVAPVYAYDRAGVGPVCDAAHVQPYTRQRLQARRPHANPPLAPIDGAAADTATAARRAMGTRAAVAIAGACAGTHGGLSLYRRADYAAHTGRQLAEHHAPGEPAPPTKRTNKLDDIARSNPGSGAAGPAIYRPSQVDHAARTSALVANGGVRADALEPVARKNVEVAALLAAARRGGVGFESARVERRMAGEQRREVRARGRGCGARGGARRARRCRGEAAGPSLTRAAPYVSLAASRCARPPQDIEAVHALRA
jgi:hypothetical protein